MMKIKRFDVRVGSNDAIIATAESYGEGADANAVVLSVTDKRVYLRKREWQRTARALCKAGSACGWKL